MIVVTDPTPSKPLDREMARYFSLLPSLTDREGQYIVIVGDQVIGFYDDYGGALAAGYATVKSAFVPFLAKQVQQNEQPIFVRGVVD